MTSVVAKQQQQTLPLSLDACKTRRTEAMPKHSLFGTSLELHDEGERENIRKLDPQSHSPRKDRQKRNRYPLSESLKSRLIPGSEAIEQTKQELASQREALSRADNALKSIEEKSLLFNSAEPSPRTDRGPKVEPHKKWFSQEDLEHAIEVNRVGLTADRRSYNRDKYGRKPPVHQYSLIGDFLRPGMEFPKKPTSSQPGTSRNAAPRGECKPDIKATVHKPTVRPDILSSNDIPPNIRHLFGTKVCDSLLSDQDKVANTMRKQEERQRELQRPSKDMKVPKLPRELHPDYEMLGNAMRQNVFPGYTINHKQGTAKTAFTDEVHLYRYPDPDTWRYQRDELSTWAEHNVIRERMKKAWAEFAVPKPKDG